MRMLTLSTGSFLGLVFAFGAGAQSPERKVAEPPAASAKLLREQLSKGGYVIYFRHGATETTGANDDLADLSKCETQRNLSAQGRAQMRDIGAAFRALHIPVGVVKSSPFCRCRDTAQLAFGKHEVSEDLYFAIDVTPEHRARITASLRSMLATPPRAGTNTVLVSHTANLSEAAGIWPKPEAAAYIFRPLRGGHFEAVAKVLPNEWATAAKAGARTR
jgi:phosphohistidine phosphatase SixA